LLVRRYDGRNRAVRFNMRTARWPSVFRQDRSVASHGGRPGPSLARDRPVSGLGV